MSLLDKVAITSRIDEINKGRGDKKNYRIVNLKSGLEVLLVSIGIIYIVMIIIIIVFECLKIR